MYGKRRRKHGRRSRRRVPRKTWMDKRGRSQRMAISALWPVSQPEGDPKEGYQQPPAAEYCFVHEGQMIMPAAQTEAESLKRIFEDFNDDLPAGYHGRSVAPSDVIELFDSTGRRYYYRDRERFVKVRFSPALAHSRAASAQGQAGGRNDRK